MIRLDTYSHIGVLPTSVGRLLHYSKDAQMANRPDDMADRAGDASQVKKNSVLQSLNQAHRRLEHLLFNMEGEPDMQAQIIAVAADIAAATDTSQDVALACILLNQNEGSYAVRHCVDTAIVALLVARALEKSTNEILTIMAAALTMNVGMLRNQEQLQSRLNAISNQEIAIIHGHPQESVNLLKQAGVTDEEWLDCVLSHHENEDGSGYPSKKFGSDIPLGAKIISLADRYCARVSSRRYRKSLLPNEALSDILLGDSQSVDPMLTACIIAVLGIYPVGAIVQLESGEVGVVASRGSGTTTPVVHVLMGPDGIAAAPVQRDSAASGYAIKKMLAEDQAGTRFTMQQVWGEEARH